TPSLKLPSEPTAASATRSCGARAAARISTKLRYRSCASPPPSTHSLPSCASGTRNCASRTNGSFSMAAHRTKGVKEQGNARATKPSVDREMPLQHRLPRIPVRPNSFGPFEHAERKSGRNKIPTLYLDLVPAARTGTPEEGRDCFRPKTLSLRSRSACPFPSWGTPRSWTVFQDAVTFGRQSACTRRASCPDWVSREFALGDER